jgi:hypothetical protein
MIERFLNAAISHGASLILKNVGKNTNLFFYSVNWEYELDLGFNGASVHVMFLGFAGPQVIIGRDREWGKGSGKV